VRRIASVSTLSKTIANLPSEVPGSQTGDNLVPLTRPTPQPVILQISATHAALYAQRH
jgi:hypothetical protein